MYMVRVKITSRISILSAFLWISYAVIRFDLVYYFPNSHFLVVLNLPFSIPIQSSPTLILT